MSYINQHVEFSLIDYVWQLLTITTFPLTFCEFQGGGKGQHWEWVLITIPKVMCQSK